MKENEKAEQNVPFRKGCCDCWLPEDEDEEPCYCYY